MSEREPKIRIIRFLNGQEVVADVLSEEDGLTLKNPLVLRLTETTPNNINIALTPFLPLAAEDTVSFKQDFVDANVFLIYIPVQDIQDKYIKAFSNIIQPTKAPLVSPGGIITG